MKKKTMSEKRRIINKLKEPVLRDYFNGLITKEQYEKRLKEIYEKYDK